MVAMDLDAVPPILIADDLSLDGRHRAFAARAKARTHLRAIDLSGIAPERAIASNHMDPLCAIPRE
jgi:hypothetical protein